MKTSDDILLQVIKAPHLSEKTALHHGEEGRNVTFKVQTDATKLQIKQAVELVFDVKVDAVNTVRVKGKTKRFGRFNGRRKDWKKAYVTLAEGSSLDFMQAE